MSYNQHAAEQKHWDQTWQVLQPPLLFVLPLALSQGFRQVYHDADGRLSYFPVDEDRDCSQGPGLLTI